MYEFLLSDTMSKIAVVLLIALLIFVSCTLICLAWRGVSYICTVCQRKIFLRKSDNTVVSIHTFLEKIPTDDRDLYFGYMPCSFTDLMDLEEIYKAVFIRDEIGYLLCPVCNKPLTSEEDWERCNEDHLKALRDDIRTAKDAEDEQRRADARREIEDACAVAIKASNYKEV